MSYPQYIPLSAGQKNDTSNIRSAEDSGVSGDGTSTVTLKKDFDSLGGYLQAIIGGKGDNTVTNNGTNNFGKQYFYNSGSKCSLENTDNIQYCDPSAKVGDAVYEYIYINTLSNGLMPGVVNGATNMIKLPIKIGEVFTSTGSTAKCQCVPLNVTESDGTQKCAAAFINSSTLNESDVKKNRCSNSILESIYNKTGFSSNPSMTSGSIGSNITSGFGFGNKSDTSDTTNTGGVTKGIGSFSPFGKSGFTTMSLQKIYNNIDRLYLVALSVLLIILFYRIIN
jgi:hypothetical protein